MRSLTYWNRLEPRPRSTDIAPALAARVRDPLWMLTRQWQFGEFTGEDAAAPAYVEVTTTEGRFLGWQTDRHAFDPVEPAHPLEPQAVGEDFTPDLASRVEVGQLFEQLLHDANAADLVPVFRAAYPVTALSDAEFAASADRESARFRQVVAGRVVDGLALFAAATAAAPDLPATPALDPSVHEAVRGALARLRSWIGEVWGGFSTTEPDSWRPDRLEYDVTLVAASPGGGTVSLAAQPGSRSDFNWHALEVAAGSPSDPPVPADAVQTTTRSVIPGRVEFRGMPNHRWWDFESGLVDFGGIKPDTRDVLKLIFIDFMLVHGNDWFIVPLEQTAGTVTRVDSVVVHDVFGGATRILRADAEAIGDQRWTLFSVPERAAPQRTSDLFALPASAESLNERGQVLEEVRFLRDDMANMAWAVEVTSENAIGKPWPGFDRSLAVRANEPTSSTAADPSAPSLRYRIQTRVPENWIPLLPVVIDPAEGDIALERSAMLTDTAVPAPILPAGRILNPSSLNGEPYRIREEEVPREGLIVSREVHRTRGTDGSTHVWISRRKRIGRGEGSSGLRFDIADVR